MLKPTNKLEAGRFSLLAKPALPPSMTVERKCILKMIILKFIPVISLSQKPANT